MVCTVKCIPHPARATEALDRLLELTVLLNDDMTQALTREGLTVARTHLLWVLHELGPATQRALADALKVTPRNVTGLVDGLAESGHVTREPHPADRRATLVTLTPAGGAVMKNMARGREDLAAQLFGDFAEDLDDLLHGIDHVTRRLRNALAAEGTR
jgi:DNA-binding MarR family transcriptional regulator